MGDAEFRIPHLNEPTFLWVNGDTSHFLTPPGSLNEVANCDLDLDYFLDLMEWKVNYLIPKFTSPPQTGIADFKLKKMNQRIQRFPNLIFLIGAYVPVRTPAAVFFESVVGMKGFSGSTISLRRLKMTWVKFLKFSLNSSSSLKSGASMSKSILAFPRSKNMQSISSGFSPAQMGISEEIKWKLKAADGLAPGVPVF